MTFSTAFNPPPRDVLRLKTSETLELALVDRAVHHLVHVSGTHTTIFQVQQTGAPEGITFFLYIQKHMDHKTNTF